MKEEAEEERLEAGAATTIIIIKELAKKKGEANANLGESGNHKVNQSKVNVKPRPGLTSRSLGRRRRCRGRR